MKAAIWTAYGAPEVIAVGELPLPEPKPNQVRIRIEAATVTAGDVEMRALRFPWYLRLPLRIFAGFRRPKRIKALGQEVAGTIDTVGPEVSDYKPGDPVFAHTGLTLGGQAEYVCVAPTATDGFLAHRPPGLSAEDATTLPFAAFEALHFLNKGALRPGEKLLVNGAGGSVGTFAVQIGKAMGAEVTAVDRADKLAMLRTLGADHVIDFARDPIPANSYDAVLDVVGRRTIGRGLRALRRGGRYLAPNPRFTFLLRKPLARLAGKRIVLGAASHGREAQTAILDLVAAGKLKPVIGRRFPLAEAAAAHRYAESPGKEGSVLLIP